VTGHEVSLVSINNDNDNNSDLIIFYIM
jgi:hypothetical protein